ncbi:hypothetical protein ABT297_13830 [Dactylosporangium sp. NPDC000555]|uniref:hypothetical protein n=1 Tax=Dactylosporangium sp. NPDC000555 TaxID=3154260 RepID=UPI0033312471
MDGSTLTVTPDAAALSDPNARQRHLPGRHTGEHPREHLRRGRPGEHGRLHLRRAGAPTKPKCHFRIRTAAPRACPPAPEDYLGRRARLARHVLAVSRGRTCLSVAALADNTTLVGAGELGFADLLTDPLDTVRRHMR